MHAHGFCPNKRYKKSNERGLKLVCAIAGSGAAVAPAIPEHVPPAIPHELIKKKVEELRSKAQCLREKMEGLHSKLEPNELASSQINKAPASTVCLPENRASRS